MTPDINPDLLAEDDAVPDILRRDFAHIAIAGARIYEDDEYVVFVASDSGLSMFSNDVAFWVAGNDDTQPGRVWLHRLQNDAFSGPIINKKFDWDISKQDIRDAMGFTEEDLDSGEWVRIVGDLRLRFRFPLDHIEGFDKETIVDQVNDYNDSEFDVKWQLMSHKQRKQYARRVLGWFDYLLVKWAEEETPSFLFTRGDKLQDTVRNRLKKNALDEVRKNITEHWQAEVDKTPLPEDSTAIRIGSHTLQFESGLNPVPGYDDECVLTSGGKVAVLHPEHPRVDLDLRPGVWEVGLLRRHGSQIEARGDARGIESTGQLVASNPVESGFGIGAIVGAPWDISIPRTQSFNIEEGTEWHQLPVDGVAFIEEAGVPFKWEEQEDFSPHDTEAVYLPDSDVDLCVVQDQRSSDGHRVTEFRELTTQIRQTRIINATYTNGQLTHLELQR